jgi:hypothetical protein
MPYAAPRIAKLSDSDPQDVKITSSGLQFRMDATISRAASTAASATCPKRWTDEGLPKDAEKKGVIASTTRESTGVVAE